VEVTRFGFENISLEIQGNVAVLTVNRPQALNALNKQVLEELDRALTEISNSPIARVLVITGKGPKAFIAGADIAAMEKMNPDEAREFSKLGKSVLSRIENLPIPTIAAVNGYALGGGNELAMASDIRIVSENARFGQPEVNLGIIPGFGGTQRLPRLIGYPKALELLMTGRVIDAKEALRIGLVHEVVPEGQALPRAMALGEELAQKSGFALEMIKTAVLRGTRLNLDEGLNLEESLFGQCFSHPDQKEGMRAFLEKRQPRFGQV